MPNVLYKNKKYHLITAKHDINNSDFIDDIKLIQKDMAKKIKINDNNYYKWGRYIWKDDLIEDMKNKKSPSIKFLKLIRNGYYPPPETSKLDYYNPIVMTTNQTNILDSLFKNGSNANYYFDNKWHLSEHAGYITINNCQIDGITVYTENERKKDNILMPETFNINNNAMYVFHTHPNELTQNKIRNLFEFPSANDLFNYMYMFNMKRIMGSLVVALEGVYMIRAINMDNDDYKLSYELFRWFEKVLTEIQNKAMTYYDDLIQVMDEKLFMTKISQDRQWINLLNIYLYKYNLMVEYHPRIKTDNGWFIPSLTLYYGC